MVSWNNLPRNLQQAVADRMNATTAARARVVSKSMRALGGLQRVKGSGHPNNTPLNNALHQVRVLQNQRNPRASSQAIRNAFQRVNRLVRSGPAPHQLQVQKFMETFHNEYHHRRLRGRGFEAMYRTLKDKAGTDAGALSTIGATTLGELKQLVAMGVPIGGVAVGSAMTKMNHTSNSGYQASMLRYRLRHTTLLTPATVTGVAIGIISNPYWTFKTLHRFLEPLTPYFEAMQSTPLIGALSNLCRRHGSLHATDTELHVATTLYEMVANKTASLVPPRPKDMHTLLSFLLLRLPRAFTRPMLGKITDYLLTHGADPFSGNRFILGEVLISPNFDENYKAFVAKTCLGHWERFSRAEVEVSVATATYITLVGHQAVPPMPTIRNLILREYRPLLVSRVDDLYAELLRSLEVHPREVVYEALAWLVRNQVLIAPGRHAAWSMMVRFLDDDSPRPVHLDALHAVVSAAYMRQANAFRRQRNWSKQRFAAHRARAMQELRRMLNNRR